MSVRYLIFNQIYKYIYIYICFLTSNVLVEFMGSVSAVAGAFVVTVCLNSHLKSFL